MCSMITLVWISVGTVMDREVSVFTNEGEREEKEKERKRMERRIREKGSETKCTGFVNIHKLLYS